MHLQSNFFVLYRFINEKPVEESLRFRVDQRKTYTDLVHSLSIDNTEVEDAGEVKAIAKNKAGQAVTIAKLVVEGNCEATFIIFITS